MFDSIIEWFIGNLDKIIDWFLDGLVELANKIIVAICDAMVYVTQFLPNITLPTFTQLTNDNQALTLINWFIPVDTLVICIGLWVTSDLIYIVIAPVLRWLKLIAR